MANCTAPRSRRRVLANCTRKKNSELVAVAIHCASRLERRQRNIARNCRASLRTRWAPGQKRRKLSRYLCCTADMPRDGFSSRAAIRPAEKWVRVRPDANPAPGPGENVLDLAAGRSGFVAPETRRHATNELPAPPPCQTFQRSRVGCAPDARAPPRPGTSRIVPGGIFAGALRSAG